MWMADVGKQIRYPPSAIQHPAVSQLEFWGSVVPSWDRRGGRAIKKYCRRRPLKGTDGVVIHGLATPSALSEELRDIS